MDPFLWGPTFWDIAFVCARDLSREESHELFRCMTTILPCSHCTASYEYMYGLIPPVSYRGSPAEWLWCIRDMVHQKLGKPAQPASKVLARLHTFTHPVSPYDVYDTVVLVAMAARTPRAVEDTCTFARIVRQVVRPATLGVHLTEPPPEARSPATLWVHMLGCKNRLHEALGEPVVTRDAARAQYHYADAESPAPPPTTGRARRSSARRWR